MQTCNYCGTELQEGSRFCGNCGRAQDAIATETAATKNSTPLPQTWMPESGTIPANWPSDSNYPTQDSAATWSPTLPVQGTPPPPPADEDKDERREALPPWSPLYGAALTDGALLDSGTYVSNAPSIQGTPQIGSAPSIQGTPQIGQAPSIQGTPQIGHAPSIQGTPQIGHAPNPAGSSTSYSNIPTSHPVQGPMHIQPVSQPIQGPVHTQPIQGPVHAQPVTHPIQGPVHTQPVTHPIQGPVHTHPISHPIHHPPEEPGIEEHHPPHRHPSQPLKHHAHHGLKAQIAGGSAVKAIVIVVTAVVVVAGGGIGAAAYLLSRPQPLISISSNYQVGNTPAGASGSTIHIGGQKFSSNSAITFLLDNHIAPGNPGAQSDAKGNFSTNVTITDAWSAGTHTLTARDASNYSTKNSVSVTIVQPGQANTPGPNGAPPDDASFTVVDQVKDQQGNLQTWQETELVTGHPDPQGGTVCHIKDTGQPIVTNGVTTNVPIPYQNTSTYTCTGSYKGGKMSLTEMLTSEVNVYSQGDGTTATCTLNTSQPQTIEILSGSYTGNNTFSGTLTYPTIPDSDFSCNGDGFNSFYNFHPSQQDTWTGPVTNLHR